MKFDGRQMLQRLGRMVVSPGLEPAQQAARIHSIERDIVLPVKTLIILTLVYYFYFSTWFAEGGSPRAEAFETIRRGFMFYVGINIVVGAFFIFTRQIPLIVMQWTVYIMGLLDGLLFAGLTFVTEGFDSILFWMFPPLILRNAISVPHATPQIALNLAVSACYVLAGVLDFSVSEADEARFFDAATRMALSIGTPENPTEPFLLRVLILLLWTFACFGIQALAERHRRELQDAVEFATRQEQLQTAGRLAAEIAHRMKNPLSIINNSAFSLERSLREGRDSAPEKLRMIREEVEKADRILTELMGYAQLAEGRVEKLDVIRELERAVEEVFPPAAKYEVTIQRNYEPGLPHLMMQRGHLSEILVNIMQNAREAMNGKGTLLISARHDIDFSAIISISDTGPGISPDKVERVFEAYFSTKEKGTGLGLAIARHNAEIYGANLRVESELGKGARFILKFPINTVMKFSK